MDSLIKPGEYSPDFTLIDLQGLPHHLVDLRGNVTVLVFWSAECEWCEQVDYELLAYREQWQGNVKILWIASNANEEAELIGRVARGRALQPMLLDTNQQVADMYGAMTTPHFFVIDSSGRMTYQGAWNDITLRKRTATQVFVPMVVEALLAGKEPPVSHSPPYGCVLVRFAEG